MSRRRTFPPVHAIRAWAGTGTADEAPICGSTEPARWNDRTAADTLGSWALVTCHECLSMRVAS